MTVPLPVTLLLEVMVIQVVALLTAVQEHPAPAVTFTLPVPADEPKDLVVGERE